jgi:hypothetical protein
MAHSLQKQNGIFEGEVQQPETNTLKQGPQGLPESEEEERSV